ncbi:MAG: VanZ family protein [Acidobacteriota bacterium]|nr:VanZ family protein [Acidobacteriota bacterium]
MTRGEKRLWILAALWLLLIYSTLYLVRGPIEYLRDRNLLRATVALVFAAAAGWIFLAVRRRRPGWREWTLLVAAAGLYLVGLWWLEQPEERLHLLEYGLLAGLVYSALLERRGFGGRVPAQRAPFSIVVAAAGFTLLAGWIDEGIQHLLPNRHYDLRDVVLNLAAGLLTVGAMHLATAARHRDGGASHFR